MVINNHQNLRIAGQDIAYCPGAGLAKATARRIMCSRGDDHRPGAVAQRLLKGIRLHAFSVDRHRRGGEAGIAQHINAAEKAGIFDSHAIARQQQGAQQTFERIDSAAGEVNLRVHA